MANMAAPAWVETPILRLTSESPPSSSSIRNTRSASHRFSGDLEPISEAMGEPKLGTSETMLPRIGGGDASRATMFPWSAR
jgi:hypothetical protein